MRRVLPYNFSAYSIMSEENLEIIISEIIREPTVFELDLENLPSSLIYKLEDWDFTVAPEKFGFNEWKQLHWYERKMPAGLLEQWPCLYYMVEDMCRLATQMTPLEEMEMRSRETKVSPTTPSF
jgi:hypothetical protein